MTQISQSKDVMVSICTITYNQAEFIKETIEGVLNQEVNCSVEFIIADDNSPDNTEEIVNDYINNHPNGHWIKYTKHIENKGMMGNFEWSLKQCRGKFIAFCEGDDFWTDHLKLKKQLDFLQGNIDYILTYTDYNKYFQKQQQLSKNIFSKKRAFVDNCFVDLLSYNPIPTASIVFRNESLSDFFKFSHEWNLHKLKIADHSLLLYLSQYGKFHYLNFPTVTYRVLENSATNGGLYNSFLFKSHSIKIRRVFARKLSNKLEKFPFLIKLYYQQLKISVIFLIKLILNHIGIYRPDKNKLYKKLNS